jgi:3-oxoacyl-[acyl-carrier-protein] synthase II
VGVSGIGIVSVFGASHDLFRDGLLDGRSGIAPHTSFDVSSCHTRLTAAIPGFDPTSWVSPMKLRRLDRTGVYAVAATKLAIEDAGASVAGGTHDSIGVVLGTSTAGGESTQTFLEALFRGGITNAPALLFDSTVGNSAASLAAIEYKLRGPNITVAHKEASGLAAIVTAVDVMREQSVTALVAGGVDAIYETVFKAHDVFKVMSSDTMFSSRLSPFDVARAGWVMGEGGFLFWLDGVDGSKRFKHGSILGVAAASAAVPLNSWPADPAPLASTMRQALADAGVRPEDVDVVYASANATGVLDATEARAIVRVFAGASRARPVVTSIKGALGEMGASGSASCAAAFLCGAAGEVPPIAGLTEPCADAHELHLARRRTPVGGPIALINSVASGGALFSVVIRVGS